jgi:hypothetical protein
LPTSAVAGPRSRRPQQSPTPAVADPGEAKTVRRNHPTKPFYRQKTELLHIGCGIIDYHGALGIATFLLRACVIADISLIQKL